MKFKTVSGSFYEVDGGKVRRLMGSGDPTPGQGLDGDWMDCLEMSPITIGRPVVFGWRFEEGILKSTMTSYVFAIYSNVTEN